MTVCGRIQHKRTKKRGVIHAVHVITDDIILQTIKQVEIYVGWDDGTTDIVCPADIVRINSRVIDSSKIKPPITLK